VATKITYCRNCAANCGLRLEVVDRRIVSVQPDRDNLVSQGYACIKGTMAADLHNGDEDRLMQCMKRGADGQFRPIDKYRAVEEIAEQLREILQQHGPRALAAFFGTTSYSDSVGKPFLKSIMAHLGAPAIFSSTTVNQSSKWVTASRMGYWANGKPVSTTTDVILVAGSNGPVSHQGYPMTPYPMMNMTAHIREARGRGVKLIVIDPRRTELARFADLFIQPRPGHDAAIFAARVRLVLVNDWYDASFCTRWTRNLDSLRTAVESFTPQRVAADAGVEAAPLEQAARWLGKARKPGIGTGTGLDMAAWSNTTEHLVEALTVLVGGLNRAGEPIPNPGVLMPRPEVELVVPPNRSWERAPKCASDSSFGKLMGEFPASSLLFEVLRGGAERIGAMFVTGANPAMCLDEPELVHAALDKLELLVTFDPRLNSATAQKSHYVIAPVLQFERAEVTTFTESCFRIPFIQYAAQAVEAPPGVIGEDEFFWRLAQRLSIPLTLKNLPFGVDFDLVPGGLKVDMERMPEREALLAWLVNQSGVSFEVVKAYPHGYRVPVEKVLRAPENDDGARLDLCPPDVAAEIAAVSAQLGARPAHGYLLASRRITESFNSSFHGHAHTRRRHGTNRLYVHPDDLAVVGARDDDAVRIRSDHGEVVGYVRSDTTMRRGVVSMTQNWGAGSQPDPLFLRGAHTGRLISMQHDLQAINRMPLQSGVPVTIEPMGFTLQQAQAGEAAPR
jgi:anaerobic selenocysteine-containing dehydrogenase